MHLEVKLELLHQTQRPPAALKAESVGKMEQHLMGSLSSWWFTSQSELLLQFSRLSSIREKGKLKETSNTESDLLFPTPVPHCQCPLHNLLGKGSDRFPSCWTRGDEEWLRNSLGQGNFLRISSKLQIFFPSLSARIWTWLGSAIV